MIDYFKITYLIRKNALTSILNVAVQQKVAILMMKSHIKYCSR